MVGKIVLIGKGCRSIDLACIERMPYSFLHWKCVSDKNKSRDDVESSNITDSLNKQNTIFLSDIPFIILLNFSEFESKILNKRIVRAVVLRCKGSTGNKNEVKKVIDSIVKTSIEKWKAHTVILRAVRSNIADISEFSRYAILGDILVTLFFPSSSLERYDIAKNIHRDFKVILSNRFMEKISYNKNMLSLRLKRLSRNAFIQSHYYASGLFTRNEADRIYYMWIENAIEENADKLLLVVDNKGKIIGYIANRIVDVNDTSYGVIELIAVDKDYRGRGLGRLLIRETIRYFITTYKVQGIFVGTQLTNIPALKLYNICGFNTIGYMVTYHTPVYHEISK